jgi:hypothetical protein
MFCILTQVLILSKSKYQKHDVEPWYTFEHSCLHEHTGSVWTRGKCGSMRREEAEKTMTKRIEVARAPAPLEAYARQFDPSFGKRNQREGFRRSVQGLLLPSERHQTLTGLVNTEPVGGAQLPRAQTLQWVLSESEWDERKVQAERLTLLRADPTTAPTAQASPGAC